MEKLELAQAGLANLSLWLGWLRSSECLSVNWDDTKVIRPRHSARHNIPLNSGLILYQLAPETKSDRGRQADVVMAFKTKSGLSIGKWYRRVRQLRPRSHGPVFCHADGRKWTSRFFRENYLYPSLKKQRDAGDPLLSQFTGEPGTANSIESRFWSLHCYRRGGRSHVSRGGWFGGRRLRKADETEVYEHGRWRRRRASENMPTAYREWTLRERIAITLYCH